MTDNSARELRDSRLAADFITLEIDGINPDPVMRWAELRSVLQHLEDQAGRVFTTAEAVSEALFDEGGGFGISWVLKQGVLDQLHTQQFVDDYVLPPRMAPGVSEKLGIYVYALIDPRDRSIFYVGKGVGDRVYSHVWSAMGAAELVEDGIESEVAAVKSAKNQRIRDIYQSGGTVEHFILRHRIEPEATADKSAYAIEQTLIDALRLVEAPAGEAVLVNIAGGHTKTEWGVIPLPELIRRYAATAAPEIERPFVVLIVNAALNPDNSKEEIYEEGRGWWLAGPATRNIADVPIFFVAADIVRAVYRASSWEQSGQGGAWRFSGPVDPELEARYVGTSVAELKNARSTRRWRQHGWHPYPVD
ncbi:GIY-YIG nuclease family protein [Rhodococcus globerulus]|uniref:GIY-YIG nuclease family protein n=1 Tax=Rhodococcus globerulus TaxID=33008 RepID=UPI0011129E00|nr:GIY-YIG nuclease family protein [Rhodococcus globerulus]